MSDFEVQAAFFSNASFKNPFNIAAFRSLPFLPSLYIAFVLCSASFKPGPPSITPARGIQSTKLSTSALLAFCLPPSILPASSVISSSPLLYSCSQTPLQHLKLQITPAPHRHTGFEFVQHLNPEGWKAFSLWLSAEAGMRWIRLTPSGSQSLTRPVLALFPIQAMNCRSTLALGNFACAHK